MLFETSEKTLQQLEDKAVIFHLSGELTQGRSLEEFKQEIQQQSPECKRHVIFDMGAVYYINSTGLGALIEIYRMYREKVLSFSIVNLQPQVARVLLNFQLFRLMRYFDTWQTALENLR
jgi:anti-sigma B factor antagonist